MKQVNIQTEKENPLAVQKISQLILKYSVPAIIAGLLSAGYNMVDQIFLGRGVGELGIAATNVAFPLSTICTALAMLFGVGGAANISLTLGKGEKEKAREISGNAAWLLLISGVIVMAISLIFLTPLLQTFGATGLILPYAKIYTRIVAIGFPMLIFSTGASNLIRADGNPAYSMVCVASGAIFNMIGSPVFLFIFDMGITGVALATLLGQVLSFALVLIYFLKKANLISVKPQYLHFKLQLVKNICKLGAAGCVTHLASAVMQITSNNLLRYYGGLSEYGSEIPLAAVGAISKVGMVCMVIAIGVAQGCQPILGYNYGAKNYARVKETYKKAVIFLILYSALIFICCQLFPGQIVGIFGTGENGFTEFASRYLRIYMLMIIGVSIHSLTSNFFTYIGKSITGFITALSRQVIFLLPVMVILPRIIGLDGVLYATPIADLCAFLLTIILVVKEFRRMK